MKCKKLVQLSALAVCALPMTFSLGSCTEEDIFDNYASVLFDSTYFTYDIDTFLNNMWGADMVHIYTYEVTNNGSKNLKHLSMQKQENTMNLIGKHISPNMVSDVEDWSSIKTNGDTITYINHKEDPTHTFKNTRFHFGAGLFMSVVALSRTDQEKYPINEVEVLNAISNPTYNNMRAANYSYYLQDGANYQADNQPAGLQLPWYWNDQTHDFNKYTNSDGSPAKYVFESRQPVASGFSRDTLKVGEHKEIVFDKVDVTRRYDFSVDIAKAADASDFVITQVHAVLAGVPTSMNFWRRTMDVENTAKIAYRLAIPEADAAGKTSVKATRQMCFMNLSYGTDTTATALAKTNGPGVMQLHIIGKWKGKDVTLNTLTNISKSIIAAGMIRKDVFGWVNDEGTKLNIKLSTPITSDMLKNPNKVAYLKD